MIYGTPYIHTPTGLVKRGVRTLKKNLLTNLKAGERFGKALDIALEIMRKTPHSRLKNQLSNYTTAEAQTRKLVIY